MSAETRTVTIPFTTTVNSRTYFPGEVTLPTKEADTVEAFLGTINGENVDPITGAIVPVTDMPLKVTNEEEEEGEKPSSRSRSRRKAGADADEEGDSDGEA